jgi:hypothetical protein
VPASVPETGGAGLDKRRPLFDADFAASQPVWDLKLPRILLRRTSLASTAAARICLDTNFGTILAGG